MIPDSMWVPDPQRTAYALRSIRGTKKILNLALTIITPL
jgi:hypothetical protein